MESFFFLNWILKELQSYQNKLATLMTKDNNLYFFNSLTIFPFINNS